VESIKRGKKKEKGKRERGEEREERIDPNSPLPLGSEEKKKKKKGESGSRKKRVQGNPLHPKKEKEKKREEKRKRGLRRKRTGWLGLPSRPQTLLSSYAIAMFKVGEGEKKREVKGGGGGLSA